MEKQISNVTGDPSGVGIYAGEPSATSEYHPPIRPFTPPDPKTSILPLRCAFCDALVIWSDDEDLVWRTAGGISRCLSNEKTGSTQWRHVPVSKAANPNPTNDQFICNECGNPCIYRVAGRCPACHELAVSRVVSGDESVSKPPATKKEDHKETYLERKGRELGLLLQKKNTAYGSSFAKAGKFLEILYPDGMIVEQYGEMLVLVRIFDKMMRIATHPELGDENPFMDIAGYGILGASLDEKF